MHTAKPNQRLARLGWILEHQAAPLHTAALEQINADLAHIDGFRPTNDQLDVSGGSPNSSVESAAMRTADLTSHANRIRNSLTALEHAVFEHMACCRRSIVEVPAAANAQLCDGRRYEGHHLPWVSHSRDEANGWHDPTCREIAGPTGLSDACLLRMNRWRARQGLDRVGVKDAA